MMPEEAGLNARYWEYAIEHAIYLINSIPHSAIESSPFDELTSKKVLPKQIRDFGCAALK